MQCVSTEQVTKVDFGDEHSKAGCKANFSLLIHGIAIALGMGNAKASFIPDTNESSRLCVGKAMYFSHHRPDVQRSVNSLSRSTRNPTTAMRRLKKDYLVLAWHERSVSGSLS